jgi:SAM-dependent methyltransferase
MRAWLDRFVLRRPFEGRSAARYLGAHRPAFGAFDDRLLAAMAEDLDRRAAADDRARVFLDVGAGDGSFAARVAAERPELQVVAVEPSADLGSSVRARAEELPIASGSVDVALCLSSLRHVRDRSAALAELRRVLKPSGVLWIVELDRDADPARVERHTGAIHGAIARAAFRHLTLATCPPAVDFLRAAEEAGFHGFPTTDREQPFFLLRLEPAAPRPRVWIKSHLDEIADVDWRHPAWWGIAAGTRLLEAWAARAPREDAEGVYASFLGANGGPRADTFMARDRVLPDSQGAPLRIARAVSRARAAIAAIAALDGTLPDQPLTRVIAWRDGWLTRAPLADPARVVFLTNRGAFVTPLAPGDEATVARALGAVCAGHPAPAPFVRLDPSSTMPTPAAVAISLEDEPRALARHLHRRAWTEGGGPWLGLGDSGALELVTTCHLAIDGYGHARLTAAIAARVDRTPTMELAALATFAREGLAGVVVAPSLAVPIDGEPLGLATRVVDGTIAFSAAAWAFGLALERAFPSRTNRTHTPTFQVPIAPGDPDDPARFARRVQFALLSVPMRDGALIPHEEFRHHAREAIDRELRGDGVLSRMALGAARARLPDRLRRWLLSSGGMPHPLVPPVEVLGGRGCLSSIRFAPGDEPPAPLYAVSSPALSASAADPHGGIVLTIVRHAACSTVSVCGTGLGANDARCDALLAGWLDDVTSLDGIRKKLSLPSARRR